MPASPAQTNYVKNADFAFFLGAIVVLHGEVFSSLAKLRTILFANLQCFELHILGRIECSHIRLV